MNNNTNALYKINDVFKRTVISESTNVHKKIHPRKTNNAT